MARIYNVLCDGCGKILLGQDRMATISETYISIVGSISFQCKEDEIHYNKRSYMFVTDDHRSETFFCDAKCFNDYLNTRKVVIENRLKAAAERRATEGNQ